MELLKSHWQHSGEHMQLSMPIQKIDKEKRTVSGYATLDNADQQDDVVLAEASQRAFKRFAGNIREMHQPVAVGRLVKFKEDTFFHNGKFFKGIYVTVYVSKGAQDTWEKVLDGTLTGFSIGGDIKDSSTEFVKEAGKQGKSIRFIKDYDLNELSLVDRPANQLANIFSIQKSATGSAITGMVADTKIVNVFWCGIDSLAKNSMNETESCHVCEGKMENIGWFEKGDNEAAQVEETVTKFLRQGEETQDQSNGEGGVEKMADEVRNEAEGEVPSGQKADGSGELTEVGATDEVTTDEEKTDEAATTDEVATTEPDFEKMFDSLKETVAQTLKDSEVAVQKAVDSAVANVEGKVAEIQKAVDDKTSEFQKSLDELSEQLGGVKTEREGVEKRLDALESATAIKKSGEVEETTKDKTVQKGLWGGTILG